MGVGTARFRVTGRRSDESKTNSWKKLAPQQSIVPLVVRPHVLSSPGPTATKLTPPATARGVRVALGSEPVPSSPK